ncbi:hypothetical protein ACFYR1_48270 [Streptomyces canus]
MAILAVGLGVVALLLVIRDVAVAVAGSGVTGWLLKVLCAPSDRQER